MGFGLSNRPFTRLQFPVAADIAGCEARRDAVQSRQNGERCRVVVAVALLQVKQEEIGHICVGRRRWDFQIVIYSAQMSFDCFGDFEWSRLSGGQLFGKPPCARRNAFGDVQMYAELGLERQGRLVPRGQSAQYVG